MGKERGRKLWIPGVVIEEMKDIKESESLFRPSEAFRKMVKYSRRGRDLVYDREIVFFGKKKKGED